LTALIVIGIIILLFTAIMMISVGADFSYISGELSVSLLVCGVKLKIFPREKKDKKETKQKTPKKEKPEKQKKSKPKKESSGIPLNMNLDELLLLVKKALHGLGKITKIVVDRFYLHIIVGGTDPYNTAILFGKLNGALASLGPICSEKFFVNEADIYTDIDFISGKHTIDIGFAITIRIGQVFSMLNSIIVGAIAVVLRNRFRVIRDKLFNTDRKTNYDEIKNEGECSNG